MPPEVATLNPIYVELCLLDVSAQRGCFQPHRACPAVRAGDVLALHPGQLSEHLVELMTQRADQLRSLSSVVIAHRTIVAFGVRNRGETA